MIRKWIFIPLVLLISCGDKDKVPSGILKPEKMQAVLWDVIKADAYTTEFIRNDTAKNAEAENIKLQQQIFAIHKITRDDFYSSYDYYKTNTPLFKKMLDSIIVQAERNRNTKVKTRPLLEVQ